jgi:hypothetical protein
MGPKLSIDAFYLFILFFQKTQKTSRLRQSRPRGSKASPQNPTDLAANNQNVWFCFEEEQLSVCLLSRLVGLVLQWAKVTIEGLILQILSSSLLLREIKLIHQLN